LNVKRKSSGKATRMWELKFLKAWEITFAASLRSWYLIFHVSLQILSLRLRLCDESDKRNRKV
jgi:hypothetical protein